MRRAVAQALQWFNDHVYLMTYWPSWRAYRWLHGGHWEHFQVEGIGLGTFDTWLLPSDWNTCGHASCESGALPPLATKRLECEVHP